jgi:hypothetical protein
MEKIMLDVLGHPVNAGDVVLTGHYGTVGVHQITRILRTTPKAVYVNVDAQEFIYMKEFPYGKSVNVQKTVRRRYDQVVVVGKQLAHNKKKYPENMI